MFEEYRAALEQSLLSANTRRAYGSRVSGYLAYVATTAQPARSLRDPWLRNETVAGFKQHLLDQGRAPTAVNDALVAVDHFFRHLGLGPAVVAREARSRESRAGLTRREQRAVLSAAAGRAHASTGVRDQALVAAVLFLGLTGTELAALDVPDIRLAGHSGTLQVRGPRARAVALPAEVASATRSWLQLREGLPAADATPALFVGRDGARLSARAITGAVRRLIEEAGVEADAARLRAPRR
jgi:integrase/recombinase XerC